MQRPSGNCWRTRSSISDDETCTRYMTPPRESWVSFCEPRDCFRRRNGAAEHLHQVSMSNKKGKQDRTVGREELHQGTQEKAQEYKLMWRRVETRTRIKNK